MPFAALIHILVVLLIFSLIYWAISQFAIPDPIGKIIRVFLIVILGIWLIYELLALLPVVR